MVSVDYEEDLGAFKLRGKGIDMSDEDYALLHTAYASNEIDPYTRIMWGVRPPHLTQTSQ